MSTRMIENQRRAYVAQATDAARRLTGFLMSLSEAQQFAILAGIAKDTGLPVDSVMLTDDPQDCTDAAAILDGVLARHPSDRWAWHVGSGCYARIHLLPKETIL